MSDVERAIKGLREIIAACEKRAHPAGPACLTELHVDDLTAIAGKARESLAALAAPQQAADHEGG